MNRTEPIPQQQTIEIRQEQQQLQIIAEHNNELHSQTQTIAELLRLRHQTTGLMKEARQVLRLRAVGGRGHIIVRVLRHAVPARQVLRRVAAAVRLGAVLVHQVHQEDKLQKIKI